MSLADELQGSVDKLIAEYKAATEDGKPSFREILSLVSSATASFAQLANSAGDSGAERKEAVLAMVDQLFEEVIAPLDIKGVPNFIEPMVDKAMKELVLYLADSWIESLVSIFNKSGWFGGSSAGDESAGDEPEQPYPGLPPGFEPY